LDYSFVSEDKMHTFYRSAHGFNFFLIGVDSLKYMKTLTNYNGYMEGSQCHTKKESGEDFGWLTIYSQTVLSSF
jgi:hypothetical protein